MEGKLGKVPPVIPSVVASHLPYEVMPRGANVHASTASGYGAGYGHVSPTKVLL